MILKYDGCIWGPWVWYRLGGGEEPKSINCRFVSRSLFGEVTLPHQFLIDLKQHYKVISVKGREIKLEGFTIYMDIHGPAEEMRFMEDTDYTCNLIDITRSGIMLRHIPRTIAYEVNPFETVVDHIKERKLVPMCARTAILNYKKMDGWSFESDGLYIGEMENTCGICHCDITSGIRTACRHEYHVECLAKWLEKAGSCPMCREAI